MRLLPLLAILVTVAARAAVPALPESEAWTTLDAGGFRIYSNASPNATRAIAVNLLRMREALGRVTTLDVHAAKPTYVLVFRNKRSFAPYRDAIFGQENAPVSGAFVQRQRANFIALDAAAEGGVARVVYHELAHHFLRNTIPALPLWIDEGLAEYYSTFSVRGDEVRVGYAIPDHVIALRGREPLIPMARFFTLDQQAPELQDSRRKARFYAQAWALVHSFLSGGEARRARLEAFLSAIRAGRPAAEATAILGDDHPAMEQEVRSYVRRRSIAFTSFRLAELAVPVPEAARPASRDEVQVALGAMLSSEELPAEVVRVDVERDSADVRAAERLYAEGKQDEAIAAMRALLVTTADEDLQEHLRGVIGAHEDRAARELQTQAMDAIIAAAKAGRTQEALSLIDTLLAKVTDEELRAQLAAMRRELEGSR